MSEKQSSKKIRKKIESYRRVIAEHERKIKENLETGRRLETIDKMQKEIAQAMKEIDKLEQTMGKRRHRGTKRRK